MYVYTFVYLYNLNIMCNVLYIYIYMCMYVCVYIYIYSTYPTSRYSSAYRGLGIGRHHDEWLTPHHRDESIYIKVLD